MSLLHDIRLVERGLADAVFGNEFFKFRYTLSRLGGNGNVVISDRGNGVALIENFYDIARRIFRGNFSAVRNNKRYIGSLRRLSRPLYTYFFNLARALAYTRRINEIIFYAVQFYIAFDNVAGSSRLI